MAIKNNITDILATSRATTVVRLKLFISNMMRNKRRKLRNILSVDLKTTVGKNEELAAKYPEADIIIVIGSDYNPK
jgi:hypothetical protein